MVDKAEPRASRVLRVWEDFFVVVCFCEIVSTGCTMSGRFSISIITLSANVCT